MPKTLTIGSQELEGILVVVERPIGLVIFAHGSGSSRFSPRNAYVARELQKAGFATLLFDLLTADEARARANVFNVALLAERVIDAVKAARVNAATSGLRIGLFGASTGAAAALAAAAIRPDDVAAVVSRGGRPDLAAPYLSEVRSPTMLIVGEADAQVVALNETALDQLNCVKGLKTIRGATHLFEEEGALEQVVEEAQFWFRAHMEASDFDRF
ncbi:MAG: dienelactone hydrolase family protein [Hyphomicrobiaceae bacterium]